MPIVNLYIYMFCCFYFQNKRAYSFCGTIEYMAPEVVKGGQTGHNFVSNTHIQLFTLRDYENHLQVKVNFFK